jgi:hypothetical protein
MKIGSVIQTLIARHIHTHYGDRINSVARVRERTEPTERPPLFGEVSANFCGKRVICDHRDGGDRIRLRLFF